MLRVKAFIAMTCLLIVAPDYIRAAQQPLTISAYRSYSINWLLTADDPSRIKLGAQWLEKDSQYANKFGDVAALPLWEFSEGTRSLDPDTIAWLARVLGNTQSRRYRSLLEKVAHANPGKIANYANESIGKLTVDAPEFVPTVSKRAEIREALRLEQEAAPLKDGSAVNLHTGMWIEEVFQELGYPGDISTVRRSRRAPFVGHIYVDNLFLVYDDKGTVEFDHDRGDWYVTAVKPRLVMRSGGAATDDIVQGILSPDEAVFREVARRASQMGVSDPAALEAAASRLRRDMQTDDDKLADGLAYLCVIIGNTGDASYRELLAQVSGNAQRSRLRKHAARALEKLAASSSSGSTKQVIDTPP